MRSLIRIAPVVPFIALWASAVPAAQDGLTKRDTQGLVTVAVTLASRPAAGTPIKATVVLDTHSAALDGVAFDQAVAMRLADGTDVAPTAVEGTQGSGHHQEAVLVFAYRQGPVRIVVKNVGGVAERSFAWELE